MHFVLFYFIFNNILIHQSNKTVTVVSVIYTTTNPVSVWDPITHLKQVKDLYFYKEKKGLMMTNGQSKHVAHVIY